MSKTKTRRGYKPRADLPRIPRPQTATVVVGGAAITIVDIKSERDRILGIGQNGIGWVLK